MIKKEKTELNDGGKYPIAVYGLDGSYTDQATKFFFKKLIGNTNGLEISEKPLFPDLFEFMESKGLAFFPFENSTGGTVVQALDLFPKYEFEILAEFYMHIEHCLLVRPENVGEKITKVYSHPQSLLQCSNFLNKNKIISVADSDNSAAGKNVAGMTESNVAAIGGELLADLYDLEIIKRNFQNSKNNVTRFLLVRKKGKKLSFEKKLRNLKTKSKTSIIFEIRNIPGALYKAIGGFVTNGINLTKIESRPSGHKNFEYYFLLEFEGDLKDKNVKGAMEELNFFSDYVKVLGSYKELK